MKIQILDQATKKPLANTRLQLQVRGKDSGYLTTTTDATGYCTLEDNLQGQQIALANTGAGAGGAGQGQGGQGGLGGSQGGQGQWIQANEGAKLYTTGATAGAKSTERTNK